jgi:hypothetical protein
MGKCSKKYVCLLASFWSPSRYLSFGLGFLVVGLLVHGYPLFIRSYRVLYSGYLLMVQYYSSFRQSRKPISAYPSPRI